MDTPAPVRPDSRRFRIALSFPGEHRAFVEQVADHLAAAVGRERVLYDKFYEAEFARLDLDVYLPRLYREQSDLIVLFLCSEYAAKRWCQLEWRHIRQLIATLDADRIMLTSFGSPGDLSELGILSGDGYVDIGSRPASEITGLILQRLGIDHLQNRLAGIRPHSEELSTQYWRSSLLDFLDKHQGLFKASGCSEASLASLRLHISAPELSRDAASSIIENFVLTALREAQDKISPLAQAISLMDKEFELRAVVEEIKKRSAVEIKALCLRECVPVNLNIIDFYAEAVKRAGKWSADFFDNHMSAFDRWIFNITNRTGARATRDLAKVLSYKMFILVGNWTTETLRAVLKEIASRLGPQVSRIATAFYEAIRKEVAQTELPQFEPRTFGEVRVSSLALAWWMEKKATTTWLTLFRKPSFLAIAQMTAARTKGTPQERLQVALVSEILSNGEQQEVSFTKDLAEHINRTFLYLHMDSSDSDKQKELRQRFAQERKVIRELQEVRSRAASLMMPQVELKGKRKRR